METWLGNQHPSASHGLGLRWRANPNPGPTIRAPPGGRFFLGQNQKAEKFWESPGPIFQWSIFSRMWKLLFFLNGIFGVFNSLASWICSWKKRTCGLWIWNHWFGVMFGIGSIQQFGLFREYVFDLSGTGDATYPKVFPRPKMNLIYPDWIVLKQASANEHPNARKEGHLYFYLKVVLKSSFKTTGVFIIFKRKLSCEKSESLNLHHEKWIELASWLKILVYWNGKCTPQ